MIVAIDKWISQFPESQYPHCKEYANDYIKRVTTGYYKMANAKVVICGLARDIEETFPYTKPRIERLGEMFRSYRVVIVENDSVDKSPELLKEWSDSHIVRINGYMNTKYTHINIISKTIGRKQHGSVTTPERLKDMAEYRNEYLKAIRQTPNIDECYVVILDTDLAGGWSYEGIANSIGHNDWSVIGSNGLFYRQVPDGVERLYMDTFAYSGLEFSTDEEKNRMRWDRGEPLVEVNSCFGGLAVYAPGVLAEGIRYWDDDCDHVTLHRQIKDRGGKVFLNPSQIVLYNQTRYA